MKYFLRKQEGKDGISSDAVLIFLNHPGGIPPYAAGIYHIAPAIYHISVRKYITFPLGKISPGLLKIPFQKTRRGVVVSFLRQRKQPPAAVGRLLQDEVAAGKGGKNAAGKGERSPTAPSAYRSYPGER